MSKGPCIGGARGPAVHCIQKLMAQITQSLGPCIGETIGNTLPFQGEPHKQGDLVIVGTGTLNNYYMPIYTCSHYKYIRQTLNPTPYVSCGAYSASCVYAGKTRLGHKELVFGYSRCLGPEVFAYEALGPIY